MVRPHLCQPLPGRSCGACCGLYNFIDRDLPSLTERLAARTHQIKTIGYHDPQKLSEWANEEHQRSRSSLLLPELPTCHFVGFLEEGRVGCLLHPLVTGGPDLRDLGAYQSKEICQAFECPSFTWLSDAELWAILQATVGWYDYGLSVTDVELLREVCKQVTEERGASFPLSWLTQEEAREALAVFFAWKVTWPYRDLRRRFGAFDVEAHRALEVPVAKIDYSRLGAEPSRFDKILLCLESSFADLSQLRRAEEMVEQALQELTRRLCPLDPKAATI